MNPDTKAELIADLRRLLPPIDGVGALDTYAEWERAHTALARRLPETPRQAGEWADARRILRLLMEEGRRG